MKSSPASEFVRLVRDFFAEYLTRQRNVSPRTIIAYRDSFRVLLAYLQRRYRKAPTRVTLADLKATTLLGFLEDLEHGRHNTVRTRNARWAAIRSFLRYAQTRATPEQLAELQKALAIPLKRCARKMVGFLTCAEVQAVIEAPNPTRWSGQRDRVLFQALFNTGARVSEIIEVRVEHLREDRSLELFGKGRRTRTVPLWRSTYSMLRQWIRRANLNPGQRIFTNRWGQPLTRSGVAKRLSQAVQTAISKCPTLRDKHVSPHTIRHATAMAMLQSGIALEVIALWLGHESPTTTHLYVEADLAMKERALRTIQPPKTKQLRFRPTDALLRLLAEV
jgi:site-specific recombinase XerD